LAQTISIIDESDHRVFILEWDDLRALPDVSERFPRGTRSRPATPADDTLSFLDELRRLNRPLLSA
jgi:hypothetical protein